MLMYGFTAVVLSVTRNNHGDEVTSPAGHAFGCGFAPGASTEDNDNRAQVATVGDLYCTSTDITITAQHRVRLPGGDEWRVDGEPEWWTSPYGAAAGGGVIHLRRVRG